MIGSSVRPLQNPPRRHGGHGGVLHMVRLPRSGRDAALLGENPPAATPSGVLHISSQERENLPCAVSPCPPCLRGGFPEPALTRHPTASVVPARRWQSPG